mmetsp:Transcript_66186/g.209235  ORF Transcript_66186/g.209235 Transcript_66186/m.209235 type:complete len:219 (+) Transcript_66186:184-840(+)
MPGQAQLITRERQGTIWRHGGPGLPRRHPTRIEAPKTTVPCPPSRIRRWALESPILSKTRKRDSAFGRKLLLLSRRHVCSVHAECTSPCVDRRCHTQPLDAHPFRWATQTEILPTPASAWPSKPARDRKLLLVSYLQVTQLQNGGAPGQGRGVAAARLAQAGTCIGPTSRAFIVVAAVCATICPTRARPRGLAIVSDEPLLPDSRPCKYLRALARALV